MTQINHPYYKVQAIDSHTWHIEDAFGDYMYLVEGEKKAAVIDTGMGFSGLYQVVTALTDKPVMVLNTHGHLDHVGANDEFEEVYINPKDEALLREHGSETFRKTEIPSFIAEVGAKLSEETVKALICKRADYPVKPLEDNMEIDLGGRILKVIALAGHTQGSVVFLDEANEMLFSGDMLCTMGVMLSFDCSSTVSEFAASMEKLKREAGGKVKAVYGGHHVWPIGLEYCDKYIACAKKLLESSEGAVKEKGTFGEFYRYLYEDIGLTYVERTLR